MDEWKSKTGADDIYLTHAEVSWEPSGIQRLFAGNETPDSLLQVGGNPGMRHLHKEDHLTDKVMVPNTYHNKRRISYETIFLRHAVWANSLCG